MTEKELTPQQAATKRENEVAQALGYPTMRRFNTALVNAHKDGKMRLFIAIISANYHNRTEEK